MRDFPNDFQTIKHDRKRRPTVFLPNLTISVFLKLFFENSGVVSSVAGRVPNLTNRRNSASPVDPAWSQPLNPSLYIIFAKGLRPGPRFLSRASPAASPSSHPPPPTTRLTPGAPPLYLCAPHPLPRFPTADAPAHCAPATVFCAIAAVFHTLPAAFHALPAVFNARSTVFFRFYEIIVSAEIKQSYFLKRGSAILGSAISVFLEQSYYLKRVAQGLKSHTI